MYCAKCGSKVPDGSSFCSSCGTRIDTQQPKTSFDTKDKSPYKSSFDKWALAYCVSFILGCGFMAKNGTVAAVFYTIGLVPAVVMCYYWAKRKGRHPALAALGVLAPIGLLGLALLKNKRKDEVEQAQASQEVVGIAAKPSSRNAGVAANVQPTLSVRSVSLQEPVQQNVWTCAKCGSTVSINDMFCTKCGARQSLPDQSVKRAEESKPEKSFGYIEELQRLAQLRDDGVLTQEEFEEKKEKILRDSA
jgi:hypothetical protein